MTAGRATACTVLPDTFRRETALHTDAPHTVRTSAKAHLPAGLLHYCILLTGFGTVFLGPLLPTLTALLHLSDSGAGALLAAQFTGAFVGGWTTAAPLRRSMLRGLAAACFGFVGLAAVLFWTPHLAAALPCLMVLGFGIGQSLTAVNLLASEKWSHRRGAALTLLNFTWSFGALTAPLLLLSLLRFLSAAAVLFGVAMLLFAARAATLSLQRALPDNEASISAHPAGLRREAYLLFCLLLFLYGGVETSLGGWLSTFDHRYSAGTTLLSMAVSTTAFWASLTLTRLLAPILLRVVPERVLLRAGLASATVAVLLMLSARGTIAITACAALAGFSLSPWFPLVLSSLVGQGATASQAGRIIAVSGLGAAAMPWLVGQISAATGSLRTALLLPAAGVAALLVLSLQKTLRTGEPMAAKSV